MAQQLAYVDTHAQCHYFLKTSVIALYTIDAEWLFNHSKMLLVPITAVHEILTFLQVLSIAFIFIYVHQRRRHLRFKVPKY